MEITGVLAGMMLGLLVNVLLVIGVNNWKRCLLLTIYQIMIISPYHTAQVVPAALADLPPRPAPHPLRRLRRLLQRGGQAAEAAGCGARHGILLLHLLLVQGWMLASAN